MYVAGRVLNINGESRAIGRLVPEAGSWLPHILASHIRLGSIRVVSQEEGEKLNKQADEELELLGKNEQESKEIRLKQKINQIESELNLIRSRESSLQFELEKSNLELSELPKVTTPPCVVPVVEEVVISSPPQQIIDDVPTSTTPSESMDRETTRELQYPKIEDKKLIHIKKQRKRSR
jgi:hypothetical protein